MRNRMMEVVWILKKIGKTLLAFGKIVVGGVSLFVGLVLMLLGVLLDAAALGVAELGTVLTGVFEKLVKPEAASDKEARTET